MEDFAKWMKQFPHKKIVIFGNHDRYEELNSIRMLAIQYLLDADITYLQDNDIVINDVKFYGAPWSPRFYDWSFNVDRGLAIAKKWTLIHDDVNVCITHTVPYGIGDEVSRGFWFGENIIENAGCKDLLNRISELKQLKLHIGGHLHLGSGVRIKNGITFINASILNEQYQVANPVRIIDI
jgi:Icc-related predicted phosphoesterase